MYGCTVRDQCTCVCAPASSSAAMKAGQLPSSRPPGRERRQHRDGSEHDAAHSRRPERGVEHLRDAHRQSERYGVPTQYRRSQRNGSPLKSSLAAPHMPASSLSTKLGRLTTPTAMRMTTATTVSTPNASMSCVGVQSSPVRARRVRDRTAWSTPTASSSRMPGSHQAAVVRDGVPGSDTAVATARQAMPGIQATNHGQEGTAIRIGRAPAQWSRRPYTAAIASAPASANRIRGR